MTEAQSMVEWLHQHSSRRIVIRAAGRRDQNECWHPRKGEATFELHSTLPDGRKVVSQVQILDELMMEPLASDMIVDNARTAIGALLNKEAKDAT